MDEETTKGGGMGTTVDLYVMGDSMRSVPAIILKREDDQLLISLAEGGAVEYGEAVCLQPGPSDSWVYGKVVRADDGSIVIRVDGSHTPDRREFSRVWGPLRLRYQVVREGFELAAMRWLRQGEGLGEAWEHPRLFMDFSGSGARFEVGEEVPLGADDNILVGVRVPDDEAEYRFTATVVRRLEGDQIAINFLETAPGAIAALVAFAEKIQERLLGLIGEDLVDEDDDGDDDPFDHLDEL
jgi:hypothetical protein